MPIPKAPSRDLGGSDRLQATVYRLAFGLALGLAFLAAEPATASAPRPSAERHAEALAFVKAQQRFVTRIDAATKSLPKWDVTHACGGVLAGAGEASRNQSLSLAVFLGPQLVATMQKIDPASHGFAAELGRTPLHDPVLKSYITWFRKVPLPVLDRYTAQPPVHVCAVYRHWRASSFSPRFDWGADAKLDPTLARAALRYLGNGPPLNPAPSLTKRVETRLIALGISAKLAHTLFT